MIGNPNDAFTNLSVKNSEALTEAPQEIADVIPAILGLVLPQLSGGLSPIALPNFGGLQLSVLDVNGSSAELAAPEPEISVIESFGTSSRTVVGEWPCPVSRARSAVTLAPG